MLSANDMMLMTLIVKSLEDKIMPKPQDYKHIAAWGRFMGSYETYIKAQQELAASENAPINAIYCNFSKDSKRWATADEIRNDEKRAYINEEAANI